MKKIWCVILTKVCFATLAAAGADIDLLLQAQTYSQNIAFRGVLQETRDNLPVYTVFYQYPLPADKKALRRMDFVQPGRTDYELKDNISQSNIQNSGGYYIVSGTTAVKQTDRQLNWFASVEPEQIAAISVKNVKRDGIDCRVLTVDLKDKPADRSPKIARIRYWVGQDRPFIYGWEVLDQQGKSLRLFSFGKVDFEVSLSEEMFALPAAAKVEVINDAQKIAQKIYSSTPVPEKFTARQRQLTEELSRAFQKMRSTTFRAVEEGRTRDNRKSYRVYYQMVQDGKVWQRKDFINPDQNWDSQKISQSNILNQDGVFIWMEQTAIKTELKNLSGGFIFYVPTNELADIKSAPAVYQSINCTQYIVTLRDPDQPAAENSPMMIKYIVEPQSSMIAGWQIYTRNGALLTTVNLERIDVNVSLSVETFAVPAGSKIVVAKNWNQINEIIQKINHRGHSQASFAWWDKFCGVMERLWLWLLAYGVYGTISLAVLSIAAIGVIKLYKRYGVRS